MPTVAAVLQSFRTALRIVIETPVFVVFALAFGLVGVLNDASGPAGVVGSFLQLLAVPAFTGAFYTVADGAHPGSNTDLRAPIAAQRYYVSPLGAMSLARLVVFAAAMVVGGSVLGHAGSDRFSTVLSGSASLTPAELVVSGVVLVVLMAIVYVFILSDTVVVLDGQTTGGSLSKSVDLVLSNFQAVAGHVVAATAMTSAVDLLVLWFVTLDRTTTAVGAVTAFQAPVSTVDIIVVAVGLTVTTPVSRTYRVCFYRTCADVAPGVDLGSGDGEWTT